VISGTLTTRPTALETYRETQWEFDPAFHHFIRVAEVGIDEDLDAFCTKIEELLAIIVLLFFGQSIFGLGDLKLSTPVQSHETHAEVGSTWALVRSQIGGVGTERAHRGRVPDIPRSLDHLATRTRRWGS